MISPPATRVDAPAGQAQDVLRRTVTLRNPADEDPRDDVYALGLSIAELLLGRRSFGTIPKALLFNEKQKGSFVDAELSKLDPELANLLEEMTRVSRGGRPYSDEVLDRLRQIAVRVAG